MAEVRDQVRVDPAVARFRSGSPVPNAELSQRVAQTIAGTIAGAKAGEDWWFTGWRVEGPYQNWIMVVDAIDGAVTLEGEVPLHGYHDPGYFASTTSIATLTTLRGRARHEG